MEVEPGSELRKALPLHLPLPCRLSFYPSCCPGPSQCLSPSGGHLPLLLGCFRRLLCRGNRLSLCPFRRPSISRSELLASRSFLFHDSNMTTVNKLEREFHLFERNVDLTKRPHTSRNTER